jgi:hypothetical protein
MLNGLRHGRDGQAAASDRTKTARRGAEKVQAGYRFDGMRMAEAPGLASERQS